MLSSNILTVFIAIFSLVNCQLNETSDENSTAILPNDEPPPKPSIWCPLHTSLYLDPYNVWLRMCSPQPCLWTNGVDQPNVTLTDNSTRVVHFNDTSRQMCTASGTFSPHFTSTNCAKVRLTIDKHFRLNHTDGSIYEFRTKNIYKIGEYLYNHDNGEALICRDKILPSDDTDDIIGRCMPYEPNVTEYQMLANRSVYLPGIQRTVRPGFYQMVNGVVRTVCLKYEQEFEKCRSLGEIFEPDLQLLNDFSLWTHDGVQITYPLGQYYIAADKSVALICIEVREPLRAETRILYATAYIISAIFSFLTILVHMFYPNLNYHAKALLCHIISMFVMFVSMTVKSFITDVPSDAGRLILFGFQYVSALAAFFWLNVLAYELWRVFASPRGNAGHLGPHRAKKRWFIAKCVYAWGIPLALCLLAIGLSYNPQTSKAFELYLNTNYWFSSNLSLYVFFYTPIIIILVENLVFFGLTVWNIRMASKGTDILNKKISKQLLRVFVKLLVVMGIFWFAEVISYSLHHKTDEAVWYVTDLINALQGVAIFLVYVCKRSTWKMLKKRWRGQKGGTSNNSKSTSSTSGGEKCRKISNVSTAITMTSVRPVPGSL